MRHGMGGTVRWACAALVACAAATAWSASAGVSGYLDAYWADLVANRDYLVAQLEGDPPPTREELKFLKKDLKRVEGILKVMEDPAASASYAGEIRMTTTLRKKKFGLGYLLDNDFRVGPRHYADLFATSILRAEEISRLPEEERPQALKTHAKAARLLPPVYAVNEPYALTDGDWPRLSKAAGILQPEPGVAAADGSVFARPVALAVDSTGKYAYELCDGCIRQFAIQEDGSLQYLDPPRRGPYSVAARSMVAHPTRGFVYLGDTFHEAIRQYAVSATGALEPLDPPEVALPAGMTKVPILAPDPEGKRLFVGWGRDAYPSPYESAVLAYEVGADGGLVPLGSLPLPSGRGLDSLAAAPATGDRHFVFAVEIDPYNAYGSKVHTLEVAGDGSLSDLHTMAFGDAGVDFFEPLYFSPSGDRLIAQVRNGAGGTLLRPYAIAADGALSEAGPGVDWAGGLDPHPDPLAVDTARGFLFASEGTRIHSLRIEADGTYTPVGKPLAITLRTPGVPDDAWNAIALTPDGTRLLMGGSVGHGLPGELVRSYSVGAAGELRPIR